MRLLRETYSSSGFLTDYTDKESFESNTELHRYFIRVRDPENVRIDDVYTVEKRVAVAGDAKLGGHYDYEVFAKDPLQAFQIVCAVESGECEIEDVTK